MPAGFQKGHVKHGGRKKGVPNKTTAGVKSAILAAGEFVGAGATFTKGRIIPGKDGLRGYLSQLAVERPELYVPLLARVIPFEVTGVDGGPIMHQLTGDSTLKEAANLYAQMLRDGSYAMSEEEALELEAVVDDSNVVRLLDAPKPKPKPGPKRK